VAISMALFIIGCGKVIGASVEPKKNVDQIICDRIFSMIEDPETAELRPVLLAQFVREIRKEVGIDLADCGDKLNGYYEVTYHLKGEHSEPLGYGMELLLKKESEDIEKCHVLNVRLLYYSPSGMIYYNSVIPEVWPIERRVSLVKR